MLHAHMTSQSRDCDGRYSHGHTYQMTMEEQTEQFGDLHFKDRVVTNIISLHGYGTLEVAPDGVAWDEQTEEGYRHVRVEWCEDECPEGNSWQRDHRAEAMGY